MLVLVVVLALVVVANLLVAGFLLWLSARITRIPAVSFRRAVLVTVGLIAVEVGLGVGQFLLFGMDWRATLVSFLLCCGLTVAAVRWPLRTTLPRAVLASIVWSAFCGAQGLLLGVAVGLLGRFVAQPYVMPTGSMAETLRGPYKIVTCPQCGHEFAVNASLEADPQPPVRSTPVIGCTCPNCRLNIEFTGVDEGPVLGLNQGDNDLVLMKSTSGRDPLLIQHFLSEDGNFNPVEPGRKVADAVPGRICQLLPTTRVFVDGTESDRDKVSELLREAAADGSGPLSAPRAIAGAPPRTGGQHFRQADTGL